MDKGIAFTIKLGPEQCIYSLHMILFRVEGERRISKSLTPKFAKEKTNSSVHPGGLCNGVLRGQRAKGEVFPFIWHVMCFIDFIE